MKKLRLFLLPQLLFLASTTLIAQESNELKSTITVSHSEVPSLLQYLFDKHGVEASERICLNIQDYELENNVKVLYDYKYDEQIKAIDSELRNTASNFQRTRLEEKRRRFTKFSDVEAIVTN